MLQIITNQAYEIAELKRTMLQKEAGERGSEQRGAEAMRTGRARRRIQYNRRFVNVVATFGRKKGSNSSS